MFTFQNDALSSEAQDLLDKLTTATLDVKESATNVAAPPVDHRKWSKNYSGSRDAAPPEPAHTRDDSVPENLAQEASVGRTRRRSRPS